MKCDLCKRDQATRSVLCETCAEAVSRLVRITTSPEEAALAGAPQAVRQAAAGTH